MFSDKKCPAKAGFEGLSPSFIILAGHLKCAQNAHGVNEIAFLQTVTLIIYIPRQG